MSLRICYKLMRWQAVHAQTSAKALLTNRSPHVVNHSHRQPESALRLCTKCAGIHTVTRTVKSNSPVLRQPGGIKIKDFSTIPKAQVNTCSALNSCGFPPSQTGCLRQPLRRRHSTAPSSSLFSKGSENATQPPVQINLDLETRLSAQNVDHLRENLCARGLDLDLDQLLTDYSRWQEVNAMKMHLETERSLIAKTMASLVKSKTPEDKTTEKEELMRRGKAIREQLRDIMPSWWDAEEKVMLQALQLPTDLHPHTPEEDQQTDCCNNSGTADARAYGTSHVKLAQELGLLKFSNAGPRAVYLLGELAELEQSLLHFTGTTMKEKGIYLIASPEIFRTVVVEGCGLDPTSKDEILTLQQKEEDHWELNAYHLKGNSLLSYTAFFTKMQLRRECLPMKMYSLARHYRPETGQDLPGLYGPVQSNRVTMFAACKSGDGVNQIHKEMEDTAWEIVQGLGLPARKMMVSAKRLAPSESLRTEMQVWAPSLQQYVPMAHVCIHNDYPSCRLMSRSLSEGKPLHMVSGVAMDTTVVLASILEHSVSQGQFRLMDVPCLNSNST